MERRETVTFGFQRHPEEVATAPTTLDSTFRRWHKVDDRVRIKSLAYLADSSSFRRAAGVHCSKSTREMPSNSKKSGGFGPEPQKGNEPSVMRYSTEQIHLQDEE